VSEIGDAVASAIEALKELVQALYQLQHELDQLDD
jgi:hypothetical protein